MLQMICETKIPSSEWSQKVCTKWWKISRLGFEWIRRARENERKKSRERVWMWPRKTVHFILFLWFVFVHATFVLSSVLAALVAYFGFLGFHSLLFTTHIFSCTCNKTNVRMKREKTPKKYAKYLSKKNRPNSKHRPHHKNILGFVCEWELLGNKMLKNASR